MNNKDKRKKLLSLVVKKKTSTLVEKTGYLHGALYLSDFLNNIKVNKTTIRVFLKWIN
jgi:hypothetical protein